MINSLNFRSLIALSPLLGSAMAASSVTYDFNSSSSGDLFEGAGVSGWSQANSNPAAFGQTFHSPISRRPTLGQVLLTQLISGLSLLTLLTILTPR